MYCIVDKERINHVVDFYWVVWRILQLTAHVQFGFDIEHLNKSGKKCRNNGSVVACPPKAPFSNKRKDIMTIILFFWSLASNIISTDFIGGCEAFCCRNSFVSSKGIAPSFIPLLLISLIVEFIIVRNFS